MGIRLVMEATSRRAPEGLTWRERYALIVLAASAMDGTRELPPGIETSPEMAARLRLSRTQLYLVLGALCEKGALVHLERGRNGVKAAYAIAPLVPHSGSERPGDPDVPPVENPLKSPSNRDASAPAKGPGSENEGSRFEVPKGPGFRDPAPYIGIKGFKTGGKTPPPPGTRPLFPCALPDAPPEEGESLTAKNPAPHGTLHDRQALAAEIRKTRDDWSTRSILRALERPAVAERPWPVVAEAMRLMVADTTTAYPGRLEYDGPWWAEAARKVQPARGRHAAPDGTHGYDHNPATGLCRECRAPEVDKVHRRRRSA
jgi:hypothetical protein